MSTFATPNPSDGQVPAGLLCDHTQDPLGIDNLHPRLSWRLASGTATAQSAYQVLVASSIDDLSADRGTLWDTGRVISRATGISYAGQPLTSRQTAFWKVRLWDEQGRPTPYSQPAQFEMGLLHPDDWMAHWFGWPAGEPGKAAYFRVAFNLVEAIQSARLYITGLGYHEPYLNGYKLTSAVLDPAYTDVAHRVFYNTHDVTPFLTQGENVLAAIVGTGWHGAPILRAQLEIIADGQHKTIVATARRADVPTWIVASGAITLNSPFDGEQYDARLERPDWTTVRYDYTAETERSAKWKQACQVSGPAGRLMAQPLEPIRIVRTRAAVTLRQPLPNIYVFDFGQNQAGWCRLRVSGLAGQTITLKYAESLHPDGTINPENLRGATATDQYILRGAGIETWEPRFTYHGYRYVQVEGLSQAPSLDDAISRVVRSDVAVRGSFSCDSPLLNRIHTMVLWTEESNLHGIPTDCPQRDERMGWLNDLAARSEELVYNFHCHRFLAKFVDDIGDAQCPRTGSITDTAPFHWGNRPADPVSVCYLLIPWLLNQHFQDPLPMRKHYEGFRAWAGFLQSQSRDHIVEYSHYGDWAPPAAHALKFEHHITPLSAGTPGPLVSTGFYHYTVDLLAKIASRLGHTADADHYHQLANRIRDAFHARFWNAGINGYATGNQACNSLALYFNLVPRYLRAAVVASLVAEVERHDHHVTTGNLCTKYLLEVLAQEGHFDTACRLALQTTYPSWGHMLERGATTLWERWEPLSGGGMNSHNHPMLGSIGSWFYRRVAGLMLDDNHPHETPHFQIRIPNSALIHQATGSIETPWGKAGVDWRRHKGTLNVGINIPWNCTGTFHAGPTAHSLMAGNHTFNLKS